MEISTILYLILTLHGAFMVGAYFVSLPVLYELYIFDNLKYFQDDTPGVFAIVELCFAFASLVIYNVTYFVRDRKDYTPLADKVETIVLEDKQTSRVLVGFYGSFFLGSLVFAILRMDGMGILFDLKLSAVSQGTCADFDWQSGCPTARFHQYSDTPITDISQCVFNAWGGEGKILKKGDLTVDWSLKENYDASKRSNLVSVANDALDLRSIGKKCDVGTYNKINNIDRCIVGEQDLPKIHYCWYWGCDKVCNDRYKLNQTWLTLSWFNAFFYLAVMVYLIIALCQ